MGKTFFFRVPQKWTPFLSRSTGGLLSVNQAWVVFGTEFVPMVSPDRTRGRKSVFVASDSISEPLGSRAPPRYRGFPESLSFCLRRIQGRLFSRFYPSCAFQPDIVHPPLVFVSGPFFPRKSLPCADWCGVRWLQERKRGGFPHTHLHSSIAGPRILCSNDNTAADLPTPVVVELERKLFSAFVLVTRWSTLIRPACSNPCPRICNGALFFENFADLSLF